MLKKKLIITFFCFLLITLSNFIWKPTTTAFSDLFFTESVVDYIKNNYPNHQFKEFLYVGVSRQQLFYFKENKIIKTYPISTSKYGAGSAHGSEQTPIGLHQIKTKHGDNVPLGGILVSRKYTGRLAQIETQALPTGKDEITTRIFTLAGLEPGINKGDPNDSYNRKIYIHGTPEEGLIGSPASHGCIRMKNTDIIELYEMVGEGSYVLIINN